MATFIKQIITPVLPLSILITQAVLAQQVEEITITAVRDTSVLYTDDTHVSSADTAQLLSKLPGANINKSGELSGIAQYRGMYGDRIQVAVNGAAISPGGPNAMDTPLHYAPVALLESLTLYRGITPVSLAQESIGGTINAQTYVGNFTEDEQFALQSRVYGGTQSNNSGTVGSLFLGFANQHHLFRGSVMKESADDSRSAELTLAPSSYERERFDIGYSYQGDQHSFSLDVASNNTGSTGTAALPMDILSVDSKLWRSAYQYQVGDFTLSVQASNDSLEHWMTNYHLRRPPQGTPMLAAPMMYRATFATGDNQSLSFKVEQEVDNGLWRYGIDSTTTEHNAQISNPNAAPFYIENFDKAQRDISGIYLERELSLSDTLGLESGIRFNRVEMDADNVSANLNPANMPSGMPVMMNMMAADLANRFNNSQLAQTENNIDWFARLSFESNSNFLWYLGLARKTRAPSYQERYLWLPLEATGGLADGLNYVGNTELDSERAHEIELGFDFNTSVFNVYPRAFYRKVDKYIQGTPSSDTMVVQFAQMMANMGMGRPGPLQFSNTKATLYGGDLEADYRLNTQWQLRALVSMVRGERDDIDDKLYRIAPDNLLVALDYSNKGFNASLEAVTYAAQDRLSVTNSELRTPGYTVFNTSARVRLNSGLELSAGINNLFDKEFLDHLSGYNRAYNPDLATFTRLPGLGRNLFARFIWNY